MTEEMELICFQLIANSGAAKSCFVEAIQAAKKGLFEDAKAKLVEAEEAFVEAHKIHAELIQKEASGEKNRIFHCCSCMPRTKWLQPKSYSY